MPKKRSTGKSRSRKPKPRQKQKQKQKQIQKVSVNVSGGGSGSGGFIPIPQAPSFDYAALANLIRPAATVDMPIVAQAARPVANLPVASGIEARSASGSIRPSFSSSSAKVGGGSSSIRKARHRRWRLSYLLLARKLTLRTSTTRAFCFRRRALTGTPNPLAL
jgi:hypothetical protein